MSEREGAVVSKVLALQLIIIAVVTAGFAASTGLNNAVSSLLGGAAAFIPNLYFAIRIHSTKNRNPRKILNSFYAGEAGKLLLTVLLFFLIFKIPHIRIIPLLSGYIAALSVFWFALAMR
ncbi:MAG: ATP synthase subunit I [Gammaproteobacteria bacterium]